MASRLIYLWSGIDWSDIPTSQKVDGFDFYFMHRVNENLPQAFIESIGFNVEIIPKSMIARHWCGLGLLVTCWAKWSSKES